MFVSGCLKKNVMSSLDSYKPLGPRLFNWEGTIEVSNHDYWGNTPLINTLWFINPGLTLYFKIATCVDESSTLGFGVSYFQTNPNHGYPLVN